MVKSKHSMALYRHITLVLLAGSYCQFVATAIGADSTEPVRPNIVFCISDDQSWLHFGAYGSKMVKTPNIDRIAREGVRFNHCYVSNPTCCPSRGTLLTGQAFYRLGEGAQNWGTLERSIPVYPELLEKAGYHVGCTGKGWAPGDWTATDRKQNPAGPLYDARRATPPVTQISDCDYTGNFRDFLAARPQGKPFCFWLGSTEPHREYQSGAGLKAGKKLSQAEVPPFLPDCPAVRTDLLDYALEIEWFDKHVGGLIDILQDIGELDNTIIVITSDNGMPFPRSKGQLYDAGTRVPLVVRWGDCVAGRRVVEDLISFSDFAPTFLDAAGVDVPSVMTGRSFMNILTTTEMGRVDSSRDHVVFGRERYYPESLPYPCRAIRTTDFLYIVNYKPERGVAGLPPRYPDADGGPAREIILAGDGSDHARWLHELSFGIRPHEELYDMAVDPWQLHNVADTPKYSDVTRQLAARLTRELRQGGDPRVLGNGDVFDEYPSRLWNSAEHLPLPFPVPD